MYALHRISDLFTHRPGLRDLWQDIDSERVLRVLMRNLDGMLFRCAMDPDWTVHFASEGCKELTGYTSGELERSQKISLEVLTHEEDRKMVRDTIMVAIEHGSRYDVEYRILCRDGSEKWVLERGICVIDELGGRVIEGFIEDITERVRGQFQLAEAELRYRSIFENSVVGMFQTTEDGHYLAANQALADLYRYATPAELISQLSDIAERLYVDPQRRASFAEEIRRNGFVRDFEAEVFCRDGSRIWISENAHAVRGPDGTLLYYEGTAENISERRQHQAQLEYQATHDPLTGLPNRNLLQDRLSQAMISARRNNEQVAVAFVDLDNFKVINDSLGHAAGDRLLVEIAKRLQHSLRAVDTVARYGGDEFVLILGNQCDPSLLFQTLERLQTALREPLLLLGHELCVKCSIGVSVYPHDGNDLATLLSHADSAMYLAKAEGKGQVQFYTPALNSAAHERLAMEGALRRAIDSEQLSVVYQPKVDEIGRVVGFEALVRWQSPEFGQVSPAKFIPLAEETGMIKPITDFVLNTACREAVPWGDLHIAVNLSARQFAADGLVKEVQQVLAESGLPASRLDLEITESMLVGDIETTVQTLTELKALGVRIAVDDFGTGYSSLAYLKRFPIDILKIDRSFVMECERGEDAMAIPRAIISLGHSLGLHIVAEGVEKQEQMDVLSQYGCEEFQGYLFAKPLQLDQVKDFLADRPQPD